jgi:uncharacterized protein (DUF924 family)
MTEAQAPAPAEILSFWREAGPTRWYSKDAAFDATLRTRFMGLWERAVSGGLSSWEASDDGALALVIVLDQFPRNMFRDEPRAYSSGALALEVANRAIGRGTARRIEPDLLEFLYLPLMHSEHLANQLRCVEFFRNADSPENLKYAEEHADIIRRFGRFPHRNGILGRVTPPQEQAFLDGGGFSG